LFFFFREKTDSYVLSVEKDLNRSNSLKKIGSFGDFLPFGGSDAKLGPEYFNKTLLYLKPHADRKQARAFIMKFLKSRNCKVLDEGRVVGGDLSDCFEKQYAEISKKAMMLEPHECSLSSTSMIEFEKKFKISWSVAVRKKLVQNSRGACEVLDISPHLLYEVWMESVRSGKMVKLGRGFYCSLIDTIPDKPAVFCINGFFAAMRAEYLAASASVHYFVVEWDNAAMSWDDFRKKVVGATNPSLAHPESLRSVMSAEWEGLGLDAPLDMMRNGVHASASAFEAMVERFIWLGVPLGKDKHLGAKLVSASIPPSLLKEWSMNPLVHGKFIFDYMENQGTLQCLETAKHLHNISLSGTYMVTLFDWHRQKVY
jgi:nucleoside diphosphate kinase